IGVDGMVNLVVPYRPKPSEQAYNPGPEYNWHWAHATNSFFFTRLSWGASYEEAMEQYLQAYPVADREKVRSLIIELEERVSPLTGWNVPLFPHRAVDPEKEPNLDDPAHLLSQLRAIQQLAETLDHWNTPGDPSVIRLTQF